MKKETRLQLQCLKHGGIHLVIMESFMAIHISGIIPCLNRNKLRLELIYLILRCIRIFPTKFVDGVVNLYHGLRNENTDQVVTAYQQWGFQNLTTELIKVLNIWAKFIYGPLLENRVRSLADGVKAANYGRKEAFRVHQALKELGPVKVPREFVFMDRAAIGLGSVFIHLKAKLNYYQLFNEQIENFSESVVAKKQQKLLHSVGYSQDRAE